jgi:hypothetical protein
MAEGKLQCCGSSIFLKNRYEWIFNLWLSQFILELNYYILLFRYGQGYNLTIVKLD